MNPGRSPRGGGGDEVDVIDRGGSDYIDAAIEPQQSDGVRPMNDGEFRGIDVQPFGTPPSCNSGVVSILSIIEKERLDIRRRDTLFLVAAIPPFSDCPFAIRLAGYVED